MAFFQISSSKVFPASANQKTSFYFDWLLFERASFVHTKNSVDGRNCAEKSLGCWKKPAINGGKITVSQLNHQEVSKSDHFSMNVQLFFLDSFGFCVFIQSILSLSLNKKRQPQTYGAFPPKSLMRSPKQTIRETNEQRETRPLHGIPLNPGWFIRSLVVVLGLWPNSTNFMERFDLMDPWDDFIWYVYLWMNGWLIFLGEIFW